MLHAAKVEATGQANLTVLGAGTLFKGDVDLGAGGLRAEGTVEGTIACEGIVSVLPGGLVRGTIEARRLVVTGRVEGTCQVTGCLELHGGGWVEGEVRTGTLVVDEGATLQGRCRRLEAQPGATPPRPARVGTGPGPAGARGAGRPVRAAVLAVLAGIALLLAAGFAYRRHRQAAVAAPVLAPPASTPAAPAVAQPAAGPVPAPAAPPRAKPAPAASRPRPQAAPREARPQEVPTPAPGPAREDPAEGAGP